MPITIDKGRTNTLTANFGYDVSADVISSEIRVSKDPDSALIATWVVTFLTDGTDGKIVMTLDDAVTKEIDVKKGYMDFKRLSNGEPLSVIDTPLEVKFNETITV